MEMDWTSIIATVMGTISTIVCAWFVYNQHTKNAHTDHEIERIKNEDKIRNKRRSDNAMIIYGVLWELLYATKADRVYIVQGHPLGNEEFLTIYFEVKRRWAEPMKPHIQKLKMSEVGRFASTIANNTLKISTPKSRIDMRSQYSPHVVLKLLLSRSCQTIGMTGLEVSSVNLQTNLKLAKRKQKTCFTRLLQIYSTYYQKFESSTIYSLIISKIVAFTNYI